MFFSILFRFLFRIIISFAARMFNTVSNPVAAIETYIGFERKSALQLARRCALNFAAKSAEIKSPQNLIVKLKFHFDFLWKYEKNAAP